MIVLTFAFELAPVKPPVIFRVDPSLFVEVPVLPLKVIGLTTSLFKLVKAPATVLALTVVPSVFVVVKVGAV